MKMIVLFGNTYPFKDEIKSSGGKWNAANKCWSVPESVHKELQEKISGGVSKKQLSGQLWEECPCCGREPVYMSLGGRCERCG